MRAFIDDAAQAVFGVIAHRHEGRADRRVRRHGLHDRQVRHRRDRQSARPDRDVLSRPRRCSCSSCSGIIARIVGFSIFRFLGYIKDELLIVLGTSSSESALPSLMEKLERLGCSKPVVGLVVPTGYSFNLDGTNIYMTLATLFIAQALGFDLTLGQQITILLVAMLTSKGASGITGAGFITLAATLAVVDPRLVPGMAIVLGIDKFMSEVPRADQPLRQRRRLRRRVVVGRRTRPRQAARQSQPDRSIRPICRPR